MDYRARIEAVLDRALPIPQAGSQRLTEAMRYSALGGGKRLRPTLVYTAGVALGASLEALDDPAAAVELIHVYSLVHDDLPAMDDDDLRRGRPSCHRAFDEATAILAGDALQALAFEILAGPEHLSDQEAIRRRTMCRLLAHRIGTVGMAGGQAIDLAHVGRSLQRVTHQGDRRAGVLLLRVPGAARERRCAVQRAAQCGVSGHVAIERGFLRVICHGNLLLF